MGSGLYTLLFVFQLFCWVILSNYHILCCVFHITYSLSHSKNDSRPSPLNSRLIDLLDLQNCVSDKSNLKCPKLNLYFFSNQLLSQFYLSQERTNNTLLAVENNKSPWWLLISSTTFNLSEMPTCSTFKMRLVLILLFSRHTHLLCGFLQ